MSSGERAEAAGLNRQTDGESLAPWIMETQLVIWSGGQSGADRAALDFALANNLPHGGWCPKQTNKRRDTDDNQFKTQQA